ncbi:MAG: hypothetical protein NTZ40_00205 [Cyanobacteria bacterium]|nr:hypothetical protein [Cyanobacteriota bacterium]
MAPSATSGAAAPLAIALEKDLQNIVFRISAFLLKHHFGLPS